MLADATLGRMTDEVLVFAIARLHAVITVVPLWTNYIGKKLDFRVITDFYKYFIYRL